MTSICTLTVTKMIEIYIDRVANIMGKGENTLCKHLFPLCFQMPYLQGLYSTGLFVKNSVQRTDPKSITKLSSVKRELNASMKSIDPCQHVQFAQPDMG